MAHIDEDWTGRRALLYRSHVIFSPMPCSHAALPADREEPRGAQVFSYAHSITSFDAGGGDRKVYLFLL